MSRDPQSATVRTPTVCEVDALAVAMDLDRACKQFEAEWEAGKQPRIEQYLASVARERTASFLQELLLVELNYLDQRDKWDQQGKQRSAQDYLRRFPEQEMAIRAAFAALGQRARVKRDSELKMLPGRSVGRYRQNAPPEGADAAPMRRLHFATDGLEAKKDTVGLSGQKTVSGRPLSQTDTLIFSDSGPYGGSPRETGMPEDGEGASGSAFAEPRQAISTLFEITKCDPGAVLGLEEEIESLPLAEMLRLASSERHLRTLEGLVRYRAKLHAAGLFAGFQWLSGYVSDAANGDQDVLQAMPVVTFFRLPRGLTQLGVVAREPTAFPTEVTERRALQRELGIDPYFVDLATAPRTLAAEVSYWRGVMKERAAGNKSFWHIDLAPTGEE